MKAMSKLVGVSSHHQWEVQELREDREFAVEYAKVAVEGLNNPEERGGSLISLRAIAEAYGGLGAVAAQAGISRESLYRALSPKGNPTLKTLVAVLKTVGLRLSVAPEKHVRVRKSKTKDDYAAA
jgi:probable addiction module antidote protein